MSIADNSHCSFGFQIQHRLLLAYRLLEHTVHLSPPGCIVGQLHGHPRVVDVVVCVARVGMGQASVSVGRSVLGVEFVCPVTTSFPFLQTCENRSAPLGRRVSDNMSSLPHANTRVPHRGHSVNDRIMQRGPPPLRVRNPPLFASSSRTTESTCPNPQASTANAAPVSRL